MSGVTIETGAAGQNGDEAALEAGRASALAEVAREENAETELTVAMMAQRLDEMQRAIDVLASRPVVDYSELESLRNRMSELEAQLEEVEEDAENEAAETGALAGAIVAEEITTETLAEETKPEETKPEDQPEERKPRRKRRFLG
jgi:TolA-binding protein